MNYLSAIRLLNKILTSKRSEAAFSGEEKKPQNSVLDLSIENADKTPQEKSEDKPDVKAIQGAGIHSFLELSDQALKFWSDSLKYLFYTPKSDLKDKVIEIPKDSTVESIIVDAGSDLDITDESSAETAQSYSEFEVIWDIAWLAMLGMIARFGVKLINLNGKSVIGVDNYEEVVNSLNQLPEEYKNIAVSSNQIVGVEYTEGTIYERLGVEGFKVTSTFDEDRGTYKHKGIDVAVPIGTPVKAPFDGIVYYVAYDKPKAGTYVEIVSADGSVGLRLLHLSEVMVSEGDKVSKGQVVAKSGNTFGKAKRKDGSDWSSGAHLHFETLWINKPLKVGKPIYGRGVPFNPLAFGSSKTENIMEGDKVPTVKVSFPTETNIGYKAKNVWSLTTSSSNPWLGQVGTVKGVNSLTFAVFQDFAHAARAAAINLIKYQTKYDVSSSKGSWTTIADIASNNKKHSYVSSKNGDNVEKWIDTVSKRAGFAKDERIDLRDEETLAKVLSGIAFQEHSASVDTSDLVTVVRHFNVIDTITSNKQK